MSLKRVTFSGILIVLIGLLQVFVVSAGTRSGVSWSAGCEGFTSNGGSILLDRNNTGEGTERFIITAVDGDGNVIFGPVADTFPTGSSLSISRGAFFPYSVAPAANPILVTIVSQAGNGFSEQLIYGTLGTCSGLPFNNARLGGDSVFNVVEGGTSPTVPLNVDPPRPTNPENIGQVVDGYVIVNTASLNIRSGDGPAYTIVGRVAGGTELVVLGRNPSRSWWFVEVGEIRGWVNGTLVALRGDLTNVPIVPIVGEIFRPRFYVFSETTLRDGPSASAAAICNINGSLEYFITGQNSDGEWIQVEANCDGVDVIGWVDFEVGAIRNSGDLGIPVTAR